LQERKNDGGVKGWFFRRRSLLAQRDDGSDKNYHQQQRDGGGCSPFPGIWIPNDHSTLRLAAKWRVAVF
jgi:hypothetical protein